MGCEALHFSAFIVHCWSVNGDKSALSDAGYVQANWLVWGAVVGSLMDALLEVLQ